MARKRRATARLIVRASVTLSMVRGETCQNLSATPCPRRGDRALSAECCLEPIDERYLRLLDPPPSLLHVEPLDPIDLGEDLPTARAWRPGELEGVAHGGRRIQIPFDRPAVDDLAALLDDAAELDRGAVRLRMTGFLFELTTGDGEQLLAGLHLALGDRPVTVVLPCEERSSGMSQQDLQAGGSAPVEKDPGADSARHGLLLLPSTCDAPATLPHDLPVGVSRADGDHGRSASIPSRRRRCARSSCRKSSFRTSSCRRVSAR